MTDRYQKIRDALAAEVERLTEALDSDHSDIQLRTAIALRDRRAAR